MVGDSKRVAMLIEGLKGGPPRVRAQCALSLGCSGLVAEEIREAVAALLEAVKDSHLQVRVNVVYALGKIGPQAAAAVPALIEALKDENATVRGCSVWALDRIDIGAKEDPRS
jgi:HEAT repeat protein